LLEIKDYIIVENEISVFWMDLI